MLWTRCSLIATLLLCLAAPSRAGIVGEYILRRKGSLVNLSIRAHGKGVTGYFLTCTPSLNEPDKTRIDKTAFRGSVVGSNLRLSMDFGDVWTGTVRGKDIKIRWPLASGKMEEVSFRRLTLKEWKGKLAAFRRENQRT